MQLEKNVRGDLKLAGRYKEEIIEDAKRRVEGMKR
jgi:hypothetical protein